MCSYGAQLKAIHRRGQQSPADLSAIHQPVLVANGETDRMVPTSNSFDLAQRLPDVDLVIYPTPATAASSSSTSRSSNAPSPSSERTREGRRCGRPCHRSQPGLGAAIAPALVDAGAKVYGAARDNTTITNPDVIPVLLDVTSPDDIANRGAPLR